MSHRRKHVTASSQQDIQPPGEGQQIVRALGSRGGNIVEVETAEGRSTLVMLPARFNKTLWVRKGGYLMIEESKVAEERARDKVTGTIVAVLYDEHIRQLVKVPGAWPIEFKVQWDGRDARPEEEGDGLNSKQQQKTGDTPQPCSGGGSSPGRGDASSAGHPASQESAAATGCQQSSPSTNTDSIQQSLDAVQIGDSCRDEHKHKNGQSQNSTRSQDDTARDPVETEFESEEEEEDEELPPLHRNPNRRVIVHDVSDSEDDS